SKQSCFSCHQQLMPALAFRAARQHGIPVDEAAAHADVASAFGYFANLDPPMDDGFGLRAANATGLKPSLATAVYARSLAARQEADGHWETVDERPPQSYSPFTATAVAISALQLYSHPSLRADTTARVEKARAWLVSHKAGNTEE